MLGSREVLGRGKGWGRMLGSRLSKGDECEESERG